jgi:hypothetical protein
MNNVSLCVRTVYGGGGGVCVEQDFILSNMIQCVAVEYGKKQ